MLIANGEFFNRIRIPLGTPGPEEKDYWSLLTKDKSELV
jgi:hypothetical protein